ncbi:MAG TPA: hypothetical protein VMW09_04835 [Desulfatiglandales bacterium]|nr:hypothetical protein [Desulfatiglandales bacterium]
MNKKEEKVRKRDLSLQSFYLKVHGLVKGLESKYPELKLVNDEPSNKPLARSNILYLHRIGEAKNAESGKAKNRG